MNPENYLYLSVLLFTIGAAGVLLRRNAIVVFMCIELMLNAANLAFVTFARMHGNLGRPDLRLLHDGGSCGRSSRRLGNHHDHLPISAFCIRRRRRPAEVLTCQEESRPPSGCSPPCPCAAPLSCCWRVVARTRGATCSPASWHSRRLSSQWCFSSPCSAATPPTAPSPSTCSVGSRSTVFRSSSDCSLINCRCVSSCSSPV